VNRQTLEVKISIAVDSSNLHAIFITRRSSSFSWPYISWQLMPFFRLMAGTPFSCSYLGVHLWNWKESEFKNGSHLPGISFLQTLMAALLFVTDSCTFHPPTIVTSCITRFHPHIIIKMSIADSYSVSSRHHLPERHRRWQSSHTGSSTVGATP
jgi:hypothetical protein